MKLQISKILSPALLVFLFASCTPPAKSVELVRSDKHPEQIIQHYHWCLVGDDLEEETTRLRDFWEDQRPPNGDYEDSIHGRLVLRDSGNEWHFGTASDDFPVGVTELVMFPPNSREPQE